MMEYIVGHLIVVINCIFLLYDRYYCVNKKPQSLQTLKNTLCYDGEIIHTNDQRCVNVICQLPSKPVCGDKVCNGSETCENCPEDCGICPYCGDGMCNGDETCNTCPLDCGVCPTPPPIDPNYEGINKIIGYYTNWAQYRYGVGHFTPEDIDPSIKYIYYRIFYTCTICICCIK